MKMFTLVTTYIMEQKKTQLINITFSPKFSFFMELGLISRSLVSILTTLKAKN